MRLVVLDLISMLFFFDSHIISVFLIKDVLKRYNPLSVDKHHIFNLLNGVWTRCFSTISVLGQLFLKIDCCISHVKLRYVEVTGGGLFFTL